MHAGDVGVMARIMNTGDVDVMTRVMNTGDVDSAVFVLLPLYFLLGVAVSQGSVDISLIGPASVATVSLFLFVSHFVLLVVREVVRGKVVLVVIVPHTYVAYFPL